MAGKLDWSRLDRAIDEMAAEGASEADIEAAVTALAQEEARGKNVPPARAAAPVGSLEAAGRLGLEAVVPLAHRVLMPLGEAIGDWAAGGEFGKTFDEESAKNVERLNETREQHPWMALGSDVAGSVVSPVRGAGAIGVAGRLAKNASRAGQVVAKMGAGAVNAGVSTGLTAYGTGATAGEALTEGAAAAPAGALSTLVMWPKALPIRVTAKDVVKSVGASTLAGGAAGALGERAARAIRGESVFEEPVEMGKAAALGAGFGLLGSAFSAASAKARDVRSQRGRNLRAADDLEEAQARQEKMPPGLKPKTDMTIERFSEGDRGIGESALEAADEALGALEARRQGFNAGFGRAEERLLRQSANKRIHAGPLLDEVDTWIAKGKLSDGTRLDEDGLSALERFRRNITEEHRMPGGKPMELPKDLSVSDLVKLRRQADELGNAGRLAGKDDVAFRALSSRLRDEMIPLADPELAALMRQHSQNLTKLEKAHGALVLREDAGLPKNASLTARATRRIAAVGMDDLDGAARDRAIEQAIADFPEIGPAIKRTRAVRAREEFSRRGARQLAHGASPKAIPGMLARSGDAILIGAHKAEKSLQGVPPVGPGLFGAALTAAARKRKQDERRTAAP